MSIEPGGQRWRQQRGKGVVSFIFALLIFIVSALSLLWIFIPFNVYYLALGIEFFAGINQYVSEVMSIILLALMSLCSITAYASLISLLKRLKTKLRPVSDVKQ